MKMGFFRWDFDPQLMTFLALMRSIADAEVSLIYRNVP